MVILYIRLPLDFYFNAMYQNSDQHRLRQKPDHKNVKTEPESYTAVNSGYKNQEEGLIIEAIKQKLSNEW